MIRHSPGQMIAEMTVAATLQTETTHQRIVLAWGQALFAEVGRVWAQLDTDDTLAYEDKLAAQVHVLEDATTSLELLSDALGDT
jgi:hypothetical protein